jgi:DnaJ homolog subfamily A member 2
LQRQPNSPPADINFTFKLTRHASIKTGPSGSRDLYHTATITLSEALFGISRILLFHLDGKGIPVLSAKGERVIQHGDVYRLVGLGMPGKPHGQRDGDLLIRFDVEMPTKDWARNQVSEVGLACQLAWTGGF